MTLISSVVQGMMAMKDGVTYISPFIGRLEDIGTDAYRLIRDLRYIIDLYWFETEIIVASIHNNKHVEIVAKQGAHIATILDSLFDKLSSHSLTSQGINDWKNFKKVYSNREWG